MKLKLEQNQRERRREMEEAGQAHEPRWFRRKRLGKSAITDEEEERWEFNGEYWDARKEGNWGKIAEADALW